MSTDKNNAPAQDGAAPDLINQQVPKAPASSDAATVVTPSAASQDEMVTMKKSDVEAMKGRQSALDIRENRLKKREEKLGRSGGFRNQPANDAPAPKGDDALDAEDEKASRGLINLALQPEYRDVLDSNPVLRDMLTKNPLAVLPLYANDAIDAEDAVDLVKEHLAGLKGKLKPVEKPADPKPEHKEETPKAGGENAGIFGKEIGTRGMDDKEYIDHMKVGDTKSIAAGIKYRMQKSFKKSA